MTEYAIEARGLEKRYGDFALQGVDLALPQGCVLGLVGENGAGKSTLIRMILGACRPDGGTVTTLGVPAGRSAAFARAREEIGVVLDDACLPQNLTAAQLGRAMAGVFARWDEKAYRAFLNRFGVPEGQRVSQLSRGTRMKLALAVAMSHGARLLVLDEATGGLDPIVREEMLDVFNDFTREETHSVLLSSHIVTDLEKICDYVVFLHEGRVLLSEEKDALDERYALLPLDEASLSRLASERPGAILRTLRAHGQLRALALRDKLPPDAPAERAGIEDIMLLLTKGEEWQ